MKRMSVVIASVGLALTACAGEADRGGSFHARLELQDAANRVRTFELGAFSTLERCVKVLDFEVTAYERAGGELSFFTNPEYTYGGRQAKGLTVPNRVIGARCDDSRSEQSGPRSG